MTKVSNQIPEILLVLLLSAVPAGRIAAQERSTDIATLLPHAGETGKWRQSDSARIFSGEDLYEFIDGGADIFIEYGFIKVISSEYRNGGMAPIKLEIYEMADDAAAFGMYSISAGSGGRTVKIGNGGSLNDSYLVFWKERYMAFVSSDDTTGETLEEILTIAENVERRIGEYGIKPRLSSMLPSQDLRECKYVRGFLGLSSVYDFDSRNIFGVREGAVGRYNDYRLFIFRYTSEEEAGKWYAYSRDNLRTNSGFSDFQDHNERFSMTDRKGSRLCVARHEGFIVVVIYEGGLDVVKLSEEIVAKIYH